MTKANLPRVSRCVPNGVLGSRPLPTRLEVQAALTEASIPSSPHKKKPSPKYEIGFQRNLALEESLQSAYGIGWGVGAMCVCVWGGGGGWRLGTRLPERKERFSLLVVCI